MGIIYEAGQKTQYNKHVGTGMVYNTIRAHNMGIIWERGKAYDVGIIYERADANNICMREAHSTDTMREPTQGRARSNNMGII